MKNIPKYHQKIWRVKTPAPELSRILARQLGISPITAQMLINRGVYTVEQGRTFLGGELEKLHRPLLLKDMNKAVERIIMAVGAGEPILVYGDYDADGITSTVLLVHLLRRLGAPVEYYLPNRLAEGYGVHLEILRKTRAAGTALVITVDCGIGALTEAEWARDNGLDLIITDHHEPPAELPRALAVINPKRTDCCYPFKELAGVGLALKLAQALLEAAGAPAGAWQEYLDLVCLGTIADIVPIRGENRILVKHGLAELAGTGRIGLRALMEVSGVDGKKLGPREVGFGLAPRLNAAGRIGSPDLAARLLLADNAAEAWEIASELDRGNRERQRVEAGVLEAAHKMLEEEPGLAVDRVLVLASENWHPGVIGIVASRLQDRYYRPVLLIALEGSEGKGSARSIPDFNIHKALAHCSEHLLEYGGHAMAAGFSIESGKIEDFRREINLYAGKYLDETKMFPRVDLDGIVDVAEVSEKLVEELSLLGPFGHENPAPLLGCLGAPVLESRSVGRDRAHLKLRLGSDKKVIDGIGFNLGAFAEVLATAEKAVDLAFVPGMNEYQGRRSVQLEVKDLGLPAALDPPGRLDQAGFLPVAASVPQNGEPEGEEIFLPEFVFGEGGEFNAPPEYPLADLSREQLKHLELIDYRGTNARLEKLTELLKSGEPSLILSPYAYQAIELAHYLKMSRPGLRGITPYCHRAVSEEVKGELIALFNAGSVSAMAVTPGVAGSMTGCAQAIVYHLPFSPEAIRQAAETVRPGGRLYLLWGSADYEENLAGLESTAPDRNYLAGLYKILQREGNGHENLVLDLDLVSRALAESGFPKSRTHTVTVGLAVMEELGLLEHIRKGKRVRVKLRPAPTEKKDLREAQTFRRLHLFKERSTAWMKKSLLDPVIVS